MNCSINVSANALGYAQIGKGVANVAQTKSDMGLAANEIQYRRRALIVDGKLTVFRFGASSPVATGGGMAKSTPPRPLCRHRRIVQSFGVGMRLHGLLCYLGFQLCSSYQKKLIAVIGPSVTQRPMWDALLRLTIVIPNSKSSWKTKL